MKLIVWLWNPWVHYQSTRHNLGWIVLDQIVEYFWWTDFLSHQKFWSHISSWLIGKRQVMYVKPQTYMNNSWSPVYKIRTYYNITLDNILVIHDDIDLEDHTIKLKYNGSHWWHNWVRDITRRLDSKAFWRLKLWVWRPSHPWHDISQYVLWSLGETELSYRRWSQTTKKIVNTIDERLKNTWGN